jgi:hypothetical protein
MIHCNIRLVKSVKLVSHIRGTLLAKAYLVDGSHLGFEMEVTFIGLTN